MEPEKWEKLFHDDAISGATLTIMIDTLMAWAGAIILYIQTVKAYNAERKTNQETEVKFVKLLRSIFDLSWVSNLQSSLKVFIELVGGIIIFWVGGVSVIKGEIDHRFTHYL